MHYTKNKKSPKNPQKMVKKIPT